MKIEIKVVEHQGETLFQSKNEDDKLFLFDELKGTIYYEQGLLQIFNNKEILYEETSGILDHSRGNFTFFNGLSSKFNNDSGFCTKLFPDNFEVGETIILQTKKALSFEDIIYEDYKYKITYETLLNEFNDRTIAGEDVSIEKSQRRAEIQENVQKPDVYRFN